MHGAHGIPPHQILDKFIKKSNKMKSQVETTKWVDGVVKGVNTIIKSGRVTSQASIDDLQKCLALIQAQVPTPFQWDTSLYTAPENNLQRSVPVMVDSEDAGVDLIDMTEHNPVLPEDGQTPPDADYLKFYLIKLETPPFWGIQVHTFDFDAISDVIS